MRSFFRFATPLFLFGACAPLVQAAPGGGVSPYGYTLFDIGGFAITNAMLTSIFFACVLVLLIRWAVGQPTLIPSRRQGVVEGLFEGIMSTMEPIVGKKLVRPAFPLITALFLFILINNWSGLLPGVGAFGYTDAYGNFKYFYRPANTDVNNTIALALIAMGLWGFFTLKYAGFRHFLDHTFGNKADKKQTGSFMFVLLSFVFLLVGVIELVGIGIRPVTLSMRLYGNIFGGENLLESIYAMSGPSLYWLTAIPFYFLELLVGLVQALVFCLLVAVYIGLSCNTGHDDHAEAHH
jgi:F-type H+-transporting ATPase subunit a